MAKKKTKRFDDGGQVAISPSALESITKLFAAARAAGNMAPGSEQTTAWNPGGSDMFTKLHQGLEATKTMRPGEERTMAKGGKVRSASKRADGAAQRGKTRGRIV